MKNFAGIVIRGLIGLLFLIILVSLANLLPINNIYFQNVLEFINANLLIIILFVIFFFIGEIFYMLNFPINLPGPIFYAYGSYFFASFIFKLLYEIDLLVGKEIFSIFGHAEQITLFLVFILVLFFGILKILAVKEKSTYEKETSWEDIGNEFKKGIYNLAIRFKQASKPKVKKKKSKTK